MNIKLPYPPSINHYWGQFRGRKYLTKKATIFREAIKLAVENEVKIKGFFSVKVILVAPDKRKRDIDNPLKPLIDALQHAGIFEDDYYMDTLICIRARDKAGNILKIGDGCAWVEIKETTTNCNFKEIDEYVNK